MLAQPLTAPAPSPFTRCFWKVITTMTIGSVIETDAAAASVTETALSPPARAEIATGRVHSVTASAYEEEFVVRQQHREERCGDDAGPHHRDDDHAKGLERVAPSTIAASSISRGISMKKLRNIQIVNG